MWQHDRERYLFTHEISCYSDNGFSSYAKVFEQLLGRARSTESIHADESAFLTDPPFPAKS